MQESSPALHSQFAKAQYLEMGSNQQHTNSSTMECHMMQQAQISKPDSAAMTSFDLPKQSHRVLPVPKLETKKVSHNAALAQSKTKNDS